MYKTMTAGLLAAVTFATSAFAQDKPAFNGPRVEAILGYDHIGAGSSVDTDDGNDDQSVGGFLYGIGAGYDVNLGKAVVGAETELSDSTGKSDRHDFTQGFGFGRVGTGRDIYVGVRAGYLVNPATLLYVKGGYTNARLNILAGDTDEELDQNFDLDGWRVGLGVERALSSNAFAKIEYRYSNYEQAHINFADGSSSPDFDVDTDRHQVALGFGYRF